MKKGLIISGNLAQDHEFIYPYYRLIEEEFEVDVCLLEGKPVKGILGTTLPPNKDQKIKTLINKYPIPEFYPNNNYFDALSKSIIYQQLSGKVAKIIYTRFLSLFKKKIPTPKQYINIKNSDLKGIGLSRQKINYINNLSVFFIEKDNTLQFETESNQEISKQLIEIKGIGQWTIDMFMMFTLCKPDILPVGDLGIKKSSAQITTLYTKDELLHRQIVAVINFPKKQIAKFMSECLVLGAVNGKDVILLNPEQKVKNGSTVA
mgnify:CR=1 FL=1